MKKLTPKDIENPKRKSGYDHVAGVHKIGQTPSWRAALGTRPHRSGEVTNCWRGPARSDALTAAQDYCDHVNSNAASLTIEDVRDDTLKSGFRGVWASKDLKSFHAQAGTAKVGQSPWFGPTRKSAEEAAQDYCDYVNGNGVSRAPKLKSAGHSSSKRDPLDDPEVENALGVLRDAKAQREGRQGYVYLLTEEIPSGEIHYVKIGYSTQPPARPGELQTGNPRRLKLLYYIPGTRADERRLQQKYIQHNVLQEWFVVTDELLAEFTESERKVAA